MSNQLPLLRGTPAQVKWAETIRFHAVNEPHTAEQLATLAGINDASWFIANRDHATNSTLSPRWKPPAPHQLQGGPPPPAKTPDLFRERKHPEDEPHDAELFAESACQMPIMGKLAVLATFSRLYRGEEAALFRHRVESQLEGLRERLIESIDRDIDGIRRILGPKK